VKVVYLLNSGQACWSKRPFEVDAGRWTGGGRSWRAPGRDHHEHTFGPDRHILSCIRKAVGLRSGSTTALPKNGDNATLNSSASPVEMPGNLLRRGLGEALRKSFIARSRIGSNLIEILYGDRKGLNDKFLRRRLCLWVRPDSAAIRWTIILSLEADDHAISAERELQPAAMRLQLHSDALVVLEP
jgi:hypothetical protein